MFKTAYLSLYSVFIVNAMREGLRVTRDPGLSGLFFASVCFLTRPNMTEPFHTAVIVHESYVLSAGAPISPFYLSSQYSQIHVK